jgi:hypothetical protein
MPELRKVGEGHMVACWVDVSQASFVAVETEEAVWAKRVS